VDVYLEKWTTNGDLSFRDWVDDRSDRLNKKKIEYFEKIYKDYDLIYSP